MRYILILILILATSIISCDSGDPEADTTTTETPGESGSTNLTWPEAPTDGTVVVVEITEGPRIKSDDVLEARVNLFNFGGLSFTELEIEFTLLDADGETIGTATTTVDRDGEVALGGSHAAIYGVEIEGNEAPASATARVISTTVAEGSEAHAVPAPVEPASEPTEPTDEAPTSEPAVEAPASEPAASQPTSAPAVDPPTSAPAVEPPAVEPPAVEPGSAPTTE